MMMIDHDDEDDDDSSIEKKVVKQNTNDVFNQKNDGDSSRHSRIVVGDVNTS